MLMSAMTRMMRLLSNLLKVIDMPTRYLCDSSYVQAVPERWLLRLYSRLIGVSAYEALNCGESIQASQDSQIAEQLKSLMNRWQTDGYDVDLG